MQEKQIKNETPLVALTVGQARELLKGLLVSESSKQDLSDDVISIEDVVKITGYEKSTIYSFTHRRVIPFHRPEHGGRRIFFKRSEIVDWMQAKRIDMHEEAFEQMDVVVLKPAKPLTKKEELAMLQEKLRQAKVLFAFLTVILELITKNE